MKRTWKLSPCVVLILCGCAPTEAPTVADSSLVRSHQQAPSEEGPEPEQQADLAVRSSAPGEKLFNSYCAACHQRGGQGQEGRVPPLDGSPWVSGSEERLIRIVLNGLRGPIEIQGKMYNLEMPSFRQLFKDDDIAAILAYVRQRYGPPRPPVTKATVARVRQQTEDRKVYWTVKELMKIP